jgi:hypothetical protein
MANQQTAADFKIVARKNPAAELGALNEQLNRCCSVTRGADGETLFDGFDLQHWAVDQFEAIARKYAEMENPGEDDGISYIRKDFAEHAPVGEIVEFSNGITEASVVVTLSAPGFMEE